MPIVNIGAFWGHDKTRMHSRVLALQVLRQTDILARFAQARSLRGFQ